jgi:hypothetical protein
VAIKGTPRSVKNVDQELVQEENVNNKIMLDELIPVMSLLDFPLNLMNQTNGKAKYRFEKFGQKKEILYQDILRIIEDYQTFMIFGYFVILDKRVINRHGLQEIQSKILTKEKIEKVLDGSQDAFTLYKEAQPEQQRVIIGMLTQKVINDPNSVNMNLIDQISRHSKINILQSAEDSKILFKKEEAVE